MAFVLRLAHAILSLWGVYLFVKLAERLISSVTWRMYAIWFWVFGGVVTVFSVHQLVETACIPFVLLAYFYVLKYFQYERMSTLIIAALAFSFSVGMRYQLVFFPLTLGMYLLWKRKWSGALLFGIFFTLGFALTQIDNLLFWHKPIYQHLLDYQAYNATHFADYPSNVFSYFALISYYIFPAITIVFLTSLRRRPSHIVPSSAGPSSNRPSHEVQIFIGVAIFIVFHLIFPNRQERFLLPAVPFVLLLMIRTISKRYSCSAPSHIVPSSERPSSKGPSHLVPSSFGPSHIVHEAMRWSIYLSIVCTLGYSFYIPKSKYLEASKALYERGDFQNVVIDNWKGEESVWLPMHYVGKFLHPLSMTSSKTIDQLKQQITHQPYYDSKRLPAPAPNYLIIWGREEAYPRAKQYEECGFQLQRLSPAQSEKENGFALYSLDFLP